MAAALQLAAPVLQQRTVSLQSHTKNETGNRKTLKDIQQLDKSSPRTLRMCENQKPHQEPTLSHQPPPLHANVAEHAASAIRLGTLTWRGWGGSTHHRSKLDLSGESFYVNSTKLYLLPRPERQVFHVFLTLGQIFESTCKAYTLTAAGITNGTTAFCGKSSRKRRNCWQSPCPLES